MSKKLRGLVNRRKFLVASAWLFIFLIFLGNTLHEEYPDEFDNILGGWYFVNGKLPYKDFFTHHNPLAYFLAAFIIFFTRQSFVWFRILLAIFYFLLSVGLYVLLKKQLKKRHLGFYPFFILILAISATYFWGQMLLADVLSGYLFLPAFALVFLKTFWKEQFNLKDLTAIFTLTFLVLLSSSSYLYLIILINGVALFQYSRGKRLRNLLSCLRVMILPYILFLIYLGLSGSLKDFYFQAIEFNARYYIYNYPKPLGSVRINPVRYAIIIANNFFNDYHSVLIQLKDFNFTFPVNTALVLADTTLLIFLFLKRRFKLALFALLTLVFSLPRSTPLFSERDYQVTVFVMLSFLNFAFVLPLLKREVGLEREYLRRISLTGLFFLMSGYWAYNLLFLFRKFNERVFEKYMGKAPLIYDRPEITPIIDSVIEKDDYVWLGPFEFEELFFLKKGKIPSKYQIILPEFVHSEKIKTELIGEFEKNKPKIVMFRKDITIRGYPVPEFSGFFLNFLHENYVHLLTYREDGSRFQQVNPPSLTLDIEQDFYIERENKGKILKRMVENNLIKKIPVE